MADDQENARVEELTARIHALTETVEQLSARLDQSSSAAKASTPPASDTPDDDEVEDLSQVAEEVLTWAGKFSLLPRISTLCFLLVVALGLRTLTDNNIIETLLGSGLGMGYAALLMLASCYGYARENPLAPVFAACGAALMAIIVVETHARFQSLPLVPAYLTLMATGIGMALISYRFNVLLPISFGTLGICLAGATIDYPDPFFPYLAMVLWTANILGYFAARLKRCSWLRWIVLLVTLPMIHLWGVKITFLLGRDGQATAMLAIPWLLPVLALFTGTYLALAIAGIVRSGNSGIARFDYALPTIVTIWAFPTASMAVKALGTGQTLLGLVGVLCAAAYFGVAFWMAGRKEAGSSGANSFIFAGTTLLALAVPAASGSFLISLPAVSLAALSILVVSLRWSSGATRAISYLAQIYAAAALAVYLYGISAKGFDFPVAVTAALLCGTSLYHYLLARRSTPPGAPGFFARFDRQDRSAVLLLLGSLTSGFFFLKVCVYHLLLNMPGNINNSFRCAQSIIINLAAAGLMLSAIYLRNREIRNVSILVTIIGAVQVFLYDLLLSHGIPLVLSIFTFGVVAALESVALGRWKREPNRKGRDLSE
jgi:hypothetical protein